MNNRYIFLLLFVLLGIRTIYAEIKDSILVRCLANDGIIAYDEENWLALNTNLKEIVVLNSKLEEKRFQLKSAIKPVCIRKDQRNIVCFDTETHSIKRYNSRFDFIEEQKLPWIWKDALLNHFTVTTKGEMIFFNVQKNELLALDKFGNHSWKKALPIDLQFALVAQYADTTYIIEKSNPFKGSIYKIAEFGTIVQKQSLPNLTMPLAMTISDENQRILLLNDGIFIDSAFYKYPQRIENSASTLKGVTLNSSKFLFFTDDSIYLIPKHFLIKN